MHCELHIDTTRSFECLCALNSNCDPNRWAHPLQRTARCVKNLKQHTQTDAHTQSVCERESEWERDVHCASCTVNINAWYSWWRSQISTTAFRWRLACDRVLNQSQTLHQDSFCPCPCSMFDQHTTPAPDIATQTHKQTHAVPFLRPFLILSFDFPFNKSILCGFKLSFSLSLSFLESSNGQACYGGGPWVWSPFTIPFRWINSVVVSIAKCIQQ